MRKFLLALVLLLAPMAFGADIYVAQTSAGANNGTSCANARGVSSLVSGDWVAGNVIHLCGTITSRLVVGGNGSSGNPIEVRFESGAKLSLPTFSVTGIGTGGGMLSLYQRSYIVVNGDVTNGRQGIIELTDNGSVGTYTNQRDGIGINVHQASNITIKNLTIRNLYRRVTPSTTGNEGGYGIYGEGLSGTNRYTNLTITQMNAAIGTTQSGGTEEIDHNLITGVQAGWYNFGSSSIDSSPDHHWFHDNELYDNGEWYDGAADNYHVDPWHLATSAAGCAVDCTWPDIQLYNNYIHGYWGDSTSFFYFECDSTPTSCPALIYNNVLVPNDTTGYETNGIIGLKDAEGIRIFNNYFRGDATVAITIENGGAGGCANIDVENNIFDRLQGVYAVLITPSTWGTRNYNIYYSSGGQAAVGANDRTSNPNVDASFKPQAGSIAIGNGLNLTSLGITTLNSDKNGIARGSSWDIGALQYQAAGSAVTKTHSGRTSLKGQFSVK